MFFKINATNTAKKQIETFKSCCGKATATVINLTDNRSVNSASEAVGIAP